MLTINHFNIRILAKGDKYGLNDALIADAPLVEFYDNRYPHTKFGQFVSRYYIETILQSPCNQGLLLDTGSKDWSVSANDMRIVRAYINQPA